VSTAQRNPQALGTRVSTIFSRFVIIFFLALRLGFSQQSFDLLLEGFVTNFPFEECSSGVHVSHYPASIEKDAHRRPAAVMFVEPPSAQRRPVPIDGHRKF
jgi:hypothetical protein